MNRGVEAKLSTVKVALALSRCFCEELNVNVLQLRVNLSGLFKMVSLQSFYWVAQIPGFLDL